MLAEHEVRVGLAKPLAAASFLVVNGLMLLGAEVLRRRSEQRLAEVGVAPGRLDDPAAVLPGGAIATVAAEPPQVMGTRTINALSYTEAATVGVAQSVGLIAGMSRDGAVMSYGLVRDLDHEASARFAFLLATPIILAAGLFKLPDLLGPLGAGIRGQSLVAAACAAVAAVVSVAFLVRWFRTRTLWPFGTYCILFGAAMVLYLTIG